MESVVIILLLVALLLIVISTCYILYVLADVIKGNSDKTTYLLSQLMFKEGYTPQETVDEMDDAMRQAYEKSKKTDEPFDPHKHLDKQEIYDE